MNGNADVIQDIYGKLKSINEHVAKKYPDRKWLYEPAARYFELINERMGMASEKPMVWYFFMMAPELFHSMDVAALSPEYTCGIMAPMGMSTKYIDISNVQMAEHICAVNRFPVGLALSGETMMPDMVVYAAANPCDSGAVSYSNLTHYWGIPYYFLDVPYISDERAYQYVGMQFNEMISFIEQRIQKKLDLDRLRETIGYSNTALEYFVQMKKFRKKKPCPLSSRGLHVIGGAMMGLSGDPFFVDYMRERYEAIKGKAEKGEGAVSGEKIRMLWIANGIDFDLSIFEWLEQKFGAVMVESLLDSYPSESIENKGDLREICYGMAVRTMKYPMARHGRGPVDAFIEECINSARDFDVDAVVYAANTGCKYHWATAQLVKERIYEELEKPTLLFEVVPWDPRVVSIDTIKDKFERFFELFF